MSDSSEQHRRTAAERVQHVRAAVVTLSDTRTEATDTSGRCIRELLEADGHVISHYEILPDEPSSLRARALELCASGDHDVILTTGGTGIARRDRTVEAIAGILERPLPGFGELFRMLSWQEIGSPAMLSRAFAGIRDRSLIFCMPGSSAAVRLAVEKLILPELRHLVHELNP